MKLLSLQGSEPSKVSGSLVLADEEGLSRWVSSQVISIIASARFGGVESDMTDSWWSMSSMSLEIEGSSSTIVGMSSVSRGLLRVDGGMMDG